MKFTNYYSSLLKLQGVPHLNVRKYQRIFNIIIIETRIDETNKLLKSSIDPIPKFIRNKSNYNLYSILPNVTSSKPPEVIFRDFIDSQ
jgi:hypothetical protein